ncbi:MAG: PAS domain-containing protein, partial [Leptolyngbyaceae bacterium]|nr:PAS domain-containing protein [Leptolyngbyaceae bacterium]
MSEDQSLKQQLDTAQRQIQQLSQQLALERETTRQLQAQWQQQVRQQQAKSEYQIQRLERIMAASPGTPYTCHVAPPYTCTYISPNVEPVLGYTPEECQAEPDFWVQRLHPQDTPRVFAAISALFEQGQLQYEYRLRHRQGHYVWLREQLTLLWDDQGESQEIAGFFTDISEQKQLDAERQQAEQSLQDQQRFIEQAIQPNPSLFVYLYDVPRDTNLFVSQSVADCLGYTAAEISDIGQNV